MRVNTFMIQEYLPMGQRIKSFYFEVFSGGNWEKMYEGSTIGNKRLIRFQTQNIELNTELLMVLIHQKMLLEELIIFFKKVLM